MPASQVLVRAEAVVNLPIDAEVIERINVRARVGVHEDDITRVAHPLVNLVADAIEVVDRRAPRCVAHENLVGGVASGLKTGHADEVVDAEVVDARGVGPGENLRLGCRSHLV